MLKTPFSTADDRANRGDVGNVCSEYLLVCQARSTSLSEGSWHFALETSDGTPVFDAGDEEMGDLNRLTLLAAVRGLEAIDGASSVTLLSNNRYLVRSLSDSLPRWRESDFVWEHFGRRIDVQHADLWRRIDRALSIHRVEACLISSRLVSAGTSDRRRFRGHDGESIELRVDSPHQSVPAPRADGAPKDQLRRWLLGNADSSPVPAPSRRFTAADLMEST
ncbi:MAG: ribonuclease HI [Rubripirellula sp.]